MSGLIEKRRGRRWLVQLNLNRLWMCRMQRTLKTWLSDANFGNVGFFCVWQSRIRYPDWCVGCSITDNDNQCHRELEWVKWPLSNEERSNVIRWKIIELERCGELRSCNDPCRDGCDRGLSCFIENTSQGDFGKVTVWTVVKQFRLRWKFGSSRHLLKDINKEDRWWGCWSKLREAVACENH